MDVSAGCAQPMPFQHVYFDHNATTPVAPEVAATVVSCLGETFGNASSIHYFGQAAKQRLESARRQVAALIHAQPAEMVFTGGGTEADNLAILGVAREAAARRGKPGHVITSAIEHPAVLSACAQLEREGFGVTRVPVGAAGVVDPGDLRAALRTDTALISIMHANNETGVVQPVEEISRIAREAGIPFHVDGVQALGKAPVDVKALGVDLYSVSAHKLYAPKGVGALYARKGVRLHPLLFGGHHERDRRPGTENIPGIAGFGAAAQLAMQRARENARLAELRDRLERTVLDRIPDTGVNGCGARVPNTTNIYFDGIDGEALVIALDLRGFAVSTGSACSSGAVTPSHVLTAMGLSAERARASIRFSLGMSNTAEQVDGLTRALEESVAHLRRISVHA
ncbi:MAG TPA: cysteine desulfurase family protein [Bryobacteraceae bacterium]|nr:cysteine desulfurase family protein [Bryobacteraceae bacterium]